MLSPMITAIEYYLPENTLTNEKLAEEFPHWDMELIYEKTGIKERHVVAKGEDAAELGYQAAKKLIRSANLNLAEIEFLIYCGQGGSYVMPSIACMMQERLNLSTSSGALDVNLGCSGFIYSLSLAKGLIESHQVNNVLIVTSEDMSKLIRPDDRSTRTISGDAAAAIFIEKKQNSNNIPGIGSFVLGTDGSGAKNITILGKDKNSSTSSPYFYVNGAEVFKFTIDMVPNLVKSTLEKAKLTMEEIDLYIFHQANRYILDHLKRKINIPDEKFYISLEYTGNTGSSSIPIAMKNALDEKRIISGNKVMLVGFGTGYSWGATVVTI
jgi:3-oxoacyl-[acyl-carrier-protein] synthase-3